MKTPLQQLPLCKGLSDEAIDELMAEGSVRHFASGEALFHEGQKARGVYFVLEGIVKVIRITSKGQERILYLARTGSMVGETACLQGIGEDSDNSLQGMAEERGELEISSIGTHPASAVATSHVESLFIPCHVLQHYLERYPALALRMLKVLATRQRMFIHKIAAQAERSAIRRVAAYILHRSYMEHNASTISLGVAREDLANLLGHARETISRQFSTLVELKAIEYNGQSGRIIQILNRDLLQSIVDDGYEA